MSPDRRADLLMSGLVFVMAAIAPLAPLAAWWFDNGDLLWLLAAPVIFFLAG